MSDVERLGHMDGPVLGLNMAGLIHGSSIQKNIPSCDVATEEMKATMELLKISKSCIAMRRNTHVTYYPCETRQDFDHQEVYTDPAIIMSAEPKTVIWGYLRRLL